MGKVVKINRNGKFLSSTDVRDFLLRSDLNTLKILMQGLGTVTITTSGNTAYVDVTHNLGYKPIVKFYTKDRDIDIWLKAPHNRLATCNQRAGYEHISVNVVRLWVGTNDIPTVPSNQTIEYKYLIFIEPNKDSWY